MRPRVKRRQQRDDHRVGDSGVHGHGPPQGRQRLGDRRCLHKQAPAVDVDTERHAAGVLRGEGGEDRRFIR
jgi:hypothetical protein